MCRQRLTVTGDPSTHYLTFITSKSTMQHVPNNIPGQTFDMWRMMYDVRWCIPYGYHMYTTGCAYIYMCMRIVRQLTYVLACTSNHLNISAKMLPQPQKNPWATLDACMQSTSMCMVYKDTQKIYIQGECTNTSYDNMVLHGVNRMYRTNCMI